MLKISIAVFNVLLLAGCASTSYYSFQNAPSQTQTIYEKGAGKSTTTEDLKSAVAVGFKNVARRGDVHPYFQVCAFNKTNTPALLDRNKITITVSDKTFRAWSYSETVSLVQMGFNKQRQSAAFTHAMAMFANLAASQTYSTTTSYGTVNAYDSNGNYATANISGQSYTSGIDTTALAIRNSETQRVSENAKARMSAEEQVAISQIEDYLGVVSVAPNSMECGKICITNEIYQYNQFTINIEFNGNTYSYLFKNSKTP